MSLVVKSLASGSSANSLLVTYRDSHYSMALLIDAGLSVRALVKFLGEERIEPGDLSGIVLTHEHHDHARSAHSLSRKFDIPIIANRKTLNRIYNGKVETLHADLPTGNRWSDGPLTVETFRVRHDAAEPVGVNVYCKGPRSAVHKISYATDLGSIDDSVRRATAGADLLVLEANHDVYRLKGGPYPDSLKSRILSDHGHLSNETAVQLMAEHLERQGPCAFWLAHLSKVNNLPKLAKNYAIATLKMRSTCPFTLDVALRDKPSATWSPGRTPLQLGLF
jgi:phosphoribosyl 1,2-cyclic phosphodiesterase